MEAQLKSRLADWITWYNWHHSQLHNSGVEQRVAFLDKCVQGLFELIVKTNEEIERVDKGRDKPINLLLPTGVVFDADIRTGE